MARQQRKKRRLAKLEAALAKQTDNEIIRLTPLTEEEEMLREKYDSDNAKVATNSLGSFFLKEFQ